jgi:SAM-dependent methyltransferase
MHHARDLGAFCREVARVLRPGGTFVGAREHVITHAADLAAFQAAHPLHRLYGGERAYRLVDYLGALRAAPLAVTLVLNPLASDVNAFPGTLASARAALARRLGLPWPALLPLRGLRLAGALLQAPGRLYTFVARRPGG